MKLLIIINLLFALLTQVASVQTVKPNVTFTAALNNVIRDLAKIGHDLVHKFTKVIVSKEFKIVIAKINELLVDLIKSLSTKTREHLKHKAVGVARIFSKFQEIGLKNARKISHCVKRECTKESTNQLIADNINDFSDILDKLNEVIQPLNSQKVGTYGKNFRYVLKLYKADPNLTIYVQDE
ncbi:uncharacterized protein LOC126894340 [Daktulosphaira vitifoliae]|uniref:uncharacterized protein LOC126894340 n=1 Tax=Daktulosphaira vitifoliae TaxID=58002 RepID=UPI0021A9F34B|nr:uncharacterized protein LOC126894340 [Daktulosphaira vitifoliae]